MKQAKLSQCKDIRNLDAMPRGLGARYLLCIEGLNGELVAAQWKRNVPDAGEYSKLYTLVDTI